MSTTAQRLIFICTFTATLFAPELFSQDRKYTPAERERFELDKQFEASVLTRDGEKFDVTEFHLTTGVYRYKAYTGEGELGILQSLSRITSIVPSSVKDHVHLHYANGSEMHARWRDPDEQRLAGRRADGSAWEARIDEIAEVEIRDVTPAEKK